MRYLKKLREREQSYRTRYERDHPHFWLFIALDAIVTVLIVGNLYNVAFGHSGVLDRDPHLLIDIGRASINLDEVKLQSTSHKVQFYWIGKNDVDHYSTEVKDPERVILNYLNSSNDPEFKSLSVIIYSSLKSFANSTRGPLHQVADVNTTNARGDLVSFNPTTLNQIEVRLVDNSSVVVLKYPRPQTVARLIADSEKIVPLT